MALQYFFQEGKDLTPGADESSKVYYARIKTSHAVDTKQLCKSIANSTTLSAGEVSNAVDALVTQLKQHLLNGASVKIDNLGIFRLSAGAAGVMDKAAFNAKNFRNKKVLFRPSTDLKEMYEEITFERITEVADEGI